jgi:hypothetical protein
MLNRYQVLLPDWLEVYVKHLVDLYGLSFSEVIRVQVCLSTLLGIQYFFPEQPIDLDFKELLRPDLLARVDTLPREDIKKRISKIYFETRKAIEFRLQNEKPDSSEKKRSQSSKA